MHTAAQQQAIDAAARILNKIKPSTKRGEIEWSFHVESVADIVEHFRRAEMGAKTFMRSVGREHLTSHLQYWDRGLSGGKSQWPDLVAAMGRRGMQPRAAATRGVPAHKTTSKVAGDSALHLTLRSVALRNQADILDRQAAALKSEAATVRAKKDEMAAIKGDAMEFYAHHLSKAAAELRNEADSDLAARE